jgi:ferric-dicitrate binding protein FerR (iron transport regulator)
MNYTEILNKLKTDSSLSKQELETLLAWVISEEGKRSIEEHILRDWNRFETSEPYDYQHLLSKLNRKIDRLPTNRIFSIQNYVRYAAAVAAVALIAVSVSFFVMDQQKKRYQNWELARNPELIEIYNPKGIRTTVTLSDGSIVILNADSRISYVKDFLLDNRTVQLEGEAFFEVAKDAFRPFVVEAGMAKMTVLGTSFNVRSYPENNYIATTLIEGSIRVEIGKEARTLLPGDQSVIRKTSHENRVREVNPEDVTGWIDGKLHFRHTPFSEIVATLERTFSVHIQVENDLLLRKNFTGQFIHGESIAQIMEIINLSTASASVYKKDINTIIIR